MRTENKMVKVRLEKRKIQRCGKALDGCQTRLEDKIADASCARCVCYLPRA